MRFFNFLFLTGILGLTMACNQEGASNEDTKEPAEEVNEELVEAHSWLEEEDAAFLVDVYSYNLMIIRYSELAMQEAGTPALQDFATRSVLFHQKLNEEIEGMARTKTIALPAQVGENVEHFVQELKGKEGDAFDEAYVNVLGDIQDKKVNQYEEAADDAYDMNLRNWASRTLPTIKAHALTVEELADRIN